MNSLQVRGKWNYSISKDFVCDQTLTHQARFLFVVLRSFASPTSPAPFPSVKRLCNLMGMNKDTVARYMKELVARGHVEKDQRTLEHNRFGSNHYYLDEAPEKTGPKSNDFPLPGFSVTEKPVPEKPSPENPVTKTRPFRKSSQKKELPLPMAPAGAGGRGFSASQEGASPPQTPNGGLRPLDPRGTAQEFCRWWDEMQVKVFGFTSPHTRKDVSAVEKLVSNGADMQLLQAVTVGAWNYYLDKDRQHDTAYWHCIKFSGNLKSFIQYFQVIMVKELSLQKSDANYRSRVNEILTGWMSVMLEQSQARLRLNNEPAAVPA